MKLLVDDAVFRAGRQSLQRLQELDERVAVGGRQRLERAARRYAAPRRARCFGRVVLRVSVALWLNFCH